ncbi:hypothetical protein QBC35DRAFT_518203 [Podospora australis]|uniref:Uncharacterized protein n=1 Tax=Podospora australis TaxID=1536484 RepID=A0AAN6WNC7_9PEZI|nr:hypothetical protein QBC35DRAFT_518203 [Podospora australis]
MCTNPPESPTPFCEPREGAQLRTGQTIEIIWSPLFFATGPNSRPRQIRVQAEFFPSSSSNTSSTLGFTSTLLSPSSGRFAWTILDSYLPPSINSLTASLAIAEPFTDSDGNGTVLEGNDSFPGPRVTILRSTGAQQPNSGSNKNNNTTNAANRGAIGGGPSPLAIVLPVIFGVLTIIVMVGCVFFRRKNPGFRMRDWVSGMMNRSGRGGFGSTNGGGGGGKGLLPLSLGQGGGYGERQSRGQRLQGKDIRVVTTDINSLRMNAVKMAGNGGFGGGGPNVFREEMRRQERVRV